MAKPHGSVRIGPISLFTLIIVLCLAVLTVLSVTTSLAELSTTERQAATTTETYQLESVGQQFVADVDAALAEGTLEDVLQRYSDSTVRDGEPSRLRSRWKAVARWPSCCGFKTIPTPLSNGKSQRNGSTTAQARTCGSARQIRRASMELKALLQEMIDKKASDVFIVAGLPLTYTADGRQVRMDMAPLMPADTKELVDAIYELSGRDEQIFTDGHNHDDDFSFAVPGMGRFRVNVFRQRGSLGAVIRVIPFTLPNPADYHIPDDVMACADFQKGLVLVTGPAGAGKSTTLACIIDKLNKARTGHIITMEDPIEYVHRHEGCIVTQREIPSDVATYAEALRSAMREAPDVILLGEMRDQETIGTAMTAAEMAQLLFSTLHTTGASSTVDRIIDAFPANQQRQIRMQLSLVLQAVVSQQLVPTVDGGIVPVFEIMTATPAIRNLIREEKTHQIDSVIASSSGAGMRTMDQSLHRLVKEGTISKEVALQHAIHQEALKKRFETEGM